MALGAFRPLLVMALYRGSPILGMLKSPIRIMSLSLTYLSLRLLSIHSASRFKGLILSFFPLPQRICADTKTKSKLPARNDAMYGFLHHEILDTYSPVFLNSAGLTPSFSPNLSPHTSNHLI